MITTTLPQATIELERPSCSSCAEFSASERTPCVGICWLHAVQVLKQDTACSHYYQPEPEPVGTEEEF